jgi:hypothetical protein
MKNRNTMIVMAPAVAITALLAAIVAPVASGDPPAVTTTITTDFSSSFTAVNPCTGGTGTVDLAGRDVVHVTDFGGGIFHLVDTQTGILTFTPDDPSALTLIGHYTTTFSEQSNPPGLQFTVGGPFDVVAVGADGSRVIFHVISRTTRTPDGTVTVSFSATQFECVPPGP